MSSIRFVCNWQVAPPLYTNGVIFSIPHRHKPIPEPPDYPGVFFIQSSTCKARGFYFSGIALVHWRNANAFFSWPASHALVTCYPSTGLSGQRCSTGLLLCPSLTDLLHILVSLSHSSLPYPHNIPCTKIRGFGMRISYFPIFEI